MNGLRKDPLGGVCTRNEGRQENVEKEVAGEDRRQLALAR